MGHTLACVLILQSLYAQNSREEDAHEMSMVGKTNVLLCRRPVEYMRMLYVRKGGQVLVQSLPAAALYQISSMMIRRVMMITVAGRAALQPVVEAVVAMLLVQMHMNWTRATVSCSSHHSASTAKKRTKVAWKKLLLASALHGSSAALLKMASNSVMETGGSNNVWRQLPAVAVWRVLMAATIRFIAVVPSAAWLTMVEASCLEPGQETLVLDRRKNRFMSIGVVFNGYGNDGWETLLKRMTMSLYVGLLELHFKTAVTELVLEAVVAYIVVVLEG